MRTPFDITDGKFFNLKYQTDAIQLALKSIETHNGTIVADVVGLGKSIIASTIAHNLRLRTIVISPPHLRSGWDAYKDEFGFTGTVFSSGKISEALTHYNDLKKPDEQFLIIVDEAHRYRNEYTEDYAMLHNLCQGNKVVLLTATPFNNDPADIYSMLKLFQIPTKSTLKTVENLSIEFRDLINQYKELRELQRQGKLSKQDVKNETAKIARTIRSIIGPLVIRRSRIDLQQIDTYKDDLKKQKIEEVIPQGPIELSYDLKELKDLYLRTLNLIYGTVNRYHVPTCHFLILLEPLNQCMPNSDTAYPLQSSISWLFVVCLFLLLFGSQYIYALPHILHSTVYYADPAPDLFDGLPFLTEQELLLFVEKSDCALSLLTTRKQKQGLCSEYHRQDGNYL